MPLRALFEFVFSFALSLAVVGLLAAVIPIANGLKAAQWLSLIGLSARTARLEWVDIACNDLLLPRPRNASDREIDAAVARIQQYRNVRLVVGIAIGLAATIGVARLV